MKKCTNCNQTIQDEAMFCPECGAKQDATENNVDLSNGYEKNQMTTQKIIEQGSDAVRMAQQVSQQIFSRVGHVVRWEKLSYIGVGMVAISVMLPLISISLLSGITSMVSISQMLTFVLLAFCCVAGYYTSEEKYNIPLSINVGILATFAVIYYKLHMVVSDASKEIEELSKIGMGNNPQAAFAMGLIKQYADKVVGLGIGVYFLLAGTLIVIIACATCRLSKKNEPINIGSIFSESKVALTEQADLGGQKIPGFVLAVIVVLVLIFVATSIEVFGVKVSSII